MQTPIASRVLSEALNHRGWTQVELASRTQLATSVVSWHLSRKRPIRDEHLIVYLSVLDHHERQILLAAWMRDTLTPDVISDVLDVTSNRIKEEVSEWSPGLDGEQQQMLSWWARQLSRDPELDSIFRAITRKAGYQVNDLISSLRAAEDPGSYQSKTVKKLGTVAAKFNKTKKQVARRKSA